LKNITGSGSNLVLSSARGVLDMTDGNNIPRVAGDLADAIHVSAPGWVQAIDQKLDSLNSHTFVSGGVSLLVNDAMQMLGGINIP
jgi:hypothetical protein